MKKLPVLASTFLLIFGIMGGANASIIPAGSLDIDFRSNDWTGAHGLSPFTVGYTGFSVTASSTGTQTAGLYQDHVDGLGILSDEKDEVDDYERLMVEFTAPQKLDGVWITDLFDYPDGNHARGEIGHVNLKGADESVVAEYDFYGDQADQGNGEIYLDLGGVEVWKAIFIVVNSGDTRFRQVGESDDNEFSIAGFNTVDTGGAVPTPEPATMILLGTGLIGLAGYGRRKSLKK